MKILLFYIEWNRTQDWDVLRPISIQKCKPLPS